MDKDSELRGWKAHCVELQDRVDRLELENSRLKSIIDAANSQEHVEKQYRYPIGLSNGVQQWTSWGSWIGGEYMRDAQERKLYARPIPADCLSPTVPRSLNYGDASLLIKKLNEAKNHE